MDAEFRCRKCQYHWRAKPDPVACPKCEHTYVDWLNYEEMKAKNFK